MCGIAGNNGLMQAASILPEGLEKPEYRGYDSSGYSVARGLNVDKPRNLAKSVTVE
jgi:glucosamine 6-phosphate synthetase-like amidotransferase/phosphosugar isomerase protein